VIGNTRDPQAHKNLYSSFPPFRASCFPSVPSSPGKLSPPAAEYCGDGGLDLDFFLKEKTDTPRLPACQKYMGKGKGDCCLCMAGQKNTQFGGGAKNEKGGIKSSPSVSTDSSRKQATLELAPTQHGGDSDMEAAWLLF